jgi:hypothetical protein
LAVNSYSLSRGGQQIKFWKYRSGTEGEFKKCFFITSLKSNWFFVSNSSKN